MIACFLNLRYIEWLKQKYPNKEIGYSGHEYGLVTTFAGVAIGAEWVERHITLDRNMWGSDQSSSIGPEGVFKLVRGIKAIESAIQFESLIRKPRGNTQITRVEFDEIKLAFRLFKVNWRYCVLARFRHDC